MKPTSADDLTDKQRRIYLFLIDEMRTEGHLPTIREIGQCFGHLSPNGTYCHLEALQRKGFLRIDHRRARSLALVGIERWEPVWEDSPAGRRAREIYEQQKQPEEVS